MHPVLNSLHPRSFSNIRIAKKMALKQIVHRNNNKKRPMNIFTRLSTNVPCSRRYQLRPDAALEIATLDVNNLTLGAFAGGVIEHGSSWTFDQHIAIFVNVLILVILVPRFNQLEVRRVLIRPRRIQFSLSSFQSAISM